MVKAETVKLMQLARQFRREGGTHDSIYRELTIIEKSWNPVNRIDYSKHHVRITWRKVRRWIRDIPRGGRVLLDDLIEEENQRAAMTGNVQGER